MRLADGGDVTATDAYKLVTSKRSFRPNADGSTTSVVNITARSLQYDVQYTWTILASTWDIDQGHLAIAIKTAEVNKICGYDHVQDFRTEQDQGPSEQLYNYAVITVGTDDGLITDYTTHRMDSIDSASVFTDIDTVWQRLVAAGA